MKSSAYTPVPASDAATGTATGTGLWWLVGLAGEEEDERPAMIKMGNRPGAMLARPKGAADPWRQRAAVAQFLGALGVAFLITWAVFSHTVGEGVVVQEGQPALAAETSEAEVVPQTQAQVDTPTETQTQALPEPQQQPQETQPQEQQQPQQPQQEQPQQRQQEQPQPQQEQPQPQQEQPQQEQPHQEQPQQQAQPQDEQQQQQQAAFQVPDEAREAMRERARAHMRAHGGATEDPLWKEMMGRGPGRGRHGVHHQHAMLSHALQRHRKQFHALNKTLPPEVLAWRASLGRVLLVISLEAREMNPGKLLRDAAFLRQLYGRIFERLIIVGPRAFPGLGVFPADLGKSGGPDFDPRLRMAAMRGGKGMGGEVGHGYQALGWLVKGPGEVPQPVVEILEGGVDGVLWMSGDVILNYWTITSADKNKAWVPRGIVKGPGWQWRTLPEPRGEAGAGHPASEEAQVNALGKAWDIWPDWAKDSFAQNSGHDKGSVAKGPLPLFYLPWASLLKVGPLIDSLAAAKVAPEFALPQIVLSAFGPQDVDPVLDSLVDTTPETRALTRYQPDAAGQYPWDYSDVLLRSEILRAMVPKDSSLEAPAARWERIAQAQAKAKAKAQAAPQG